MRKKTHTIKKYQISMYLDQSNKVLHGTNDKWLQLRNVVVSRTHMNQ